jgi:hypothetical protein
MDSNQHSHVVVVYPSYEVAISVFDQLIMAGFSPAKVLIVGKEFIQHCCHGEALHPHQPVRQASKQVFVSSGSALNVGWRIGSILGGTIGILLGHSISSLPGVNGIMLLSKIIFALASGFFCSVSGGIIGTLIVWQMSQKQASREWNDRLTQGDYLLVIKGSKDEITRAKRFLTTSFKEKVSPEY